MRTALTKMPIIPHCLLLIDAGLALAFLVNHMIGTPSEYVTHQINLNGEGNLAAWYASAKLLGVSVLLGFTSHMRLQVRDMRGWLLAAVALAFLALSADETAQVHEWLGGQSDRFLPGGTREDTLFSYTGIWMFVLGIPFAILLASALYGLRGVFAAAQGSLQMFFVGASLWLLGALGAEILGNVAEEGSLGFIIAIFLEEFLEMVGVTVMFWSAYVLERVTRSDLDRGPYRERPLRSQDPEEHTLPREI